MTPRPLLHPPTETRRNARRLIPALGLALALSGCGGTTGPQPTPANYVGTANAATGPGLFGPGGISLGTGGGKGRADEAPTLGVNAYLWRGALDTLSFMPLASADPFGGVIITDWYEPPTPDGAAPPANRERFKATAYILGRELRSDGVRVSIFRQVLDDGHWVDASVSPTTIGDIENKMLARARELRAQQASR